MALPNLASTSDLSARGVTTTAVHNTMLAVASSIVRGAAKSPILETESTVSLWILDDRDAQWLDLPGQPVTAVESVTVDGTAVSGFKLVHGRLWLGYWGTPCEPVEVEVTMTHGFAEVPEHIKQLVCDLAILGANAATDGAHDPNVLMESIDDYRVTFAEPGATVASAMSLPRATRLALAAEFGGGTGQVVFR